MEVEPNRPQTRISEIAEWPVKQPGGPFFRASAKGWVAFAVACFLFVILRRRRRTCLWPQGLTKEKTQVSHTEFRPTASPGGTNSTPFSWSGLNGIGFQQDGLECGTRRLTLLSLHRLLGVSLKKIHCRLLIPLHCLPELNKIRISNQFTLSVVRNYLYCVDRQRIRVRCSSRWSTLRC
jgi:hypothetical protein